MVEPKSHARATVRGRLVDSVVLTTGALVSGTELFPVVQVTRHRSNGPLAPPAYLGIGGYSARESVFAAHTRDPE